MFCGYCGDGKKANFCFLHHLLINREPYFEDGVSPEWKISLHGRITTLDDFMERMDTVVDMIKCELCIVGWIWVKVM